LSSGSWTSISGRCNWSTRSRVTRSRDQRRNSAAADRHV
jgi:hypothetical protein